MTYAARLNENLQDVNVADVQDRASFLHPLPVVSEFIEDARQWLHDAAVENGSDVEEALDEWCGPTELEDGSDWFVENLGPVVFYRYMEEFGEAPARPSDLYEFAAMDLAVAVIGMIRDLAAGDEG